MESIIGTRVDALRELAHPDRMRVFSALHRRPMSRLELQAELQDVASTTLFRHLNRMVDAGLIRVIGERTSGANQEKLFEAVPLDLDLEESASLSPHDYVAFVSALAADLVQTVQFAAHSLEGLPGRSTFGVQVFFATQAEYLVLQDRFDELLGDIDRSFSPARGRTQWSLSYGICSRQR